MKTTLDISRQLNTNPPPQNVTTETRGVSMDEDGDGGRVKGHDDGGRCCQEAAGLMETERQRAAAVGRTARTFTSETT